MTGLDVETDLGVEKVAARDTPAGFVQQVEDPMVVAVLAEALAQLRDPRQITDTGYAAMPLSGHRVVSYVPSAIAYPATAGAVSSGALALTAAAADPGAVVALVVEGLVDDAGWSWPAPCPVYLGSSGHLTSTPTDVAGVLVQVGVAVSATRIVFRPSDPITLA